MNYPGVKHPRGWIIRWWVIRGWIIRGWVIRGWIIRVWIILDPFFSSKILEFCKRMYAYQHRMSAIEVQSFFPIFLVFFYLVKARNLKQQSFLIFRGYLRTIFLLYIRESSGLWKLQIVFVTQHKIRSSLSSWNIIIDLRVSHKLRSYWLKYYINYTGQQHIYFFTFVPIFL